MYKPLLTLLIAGMVFTFTVIFLSILGRNRAHMDRRITKLLSDGRAENETSKKKKARKHGDSQKTQKALLKVENTLSSAGLLIRPSEFLIGWLLISLGPAILVFALSENVTIALGLLIIGVFLPPYYVHAKRVKRVELFEKQLIEAIAIICNSLRSGLTLQQAMISISKEMPDPIAKEFGRVLREINLGSNLEKALGNMSERLNSKNFMMIVSAILIQRQIGGNLSEILANISNTIKERFRIKNEIKVLTTTGRSSGKIIGMLPIVILLFFMLINPSYVEGFFDTTAGIIMLCVAGGLETIGFLFIRHMMNIKY